jgi:hypothetical protein
MQFAFAASASISGALRNGLQGIPVSAAADARLTDVRRYERLSSHACTRDLPVVVLTSSSQDVDEWQATTSARTTSSASPLSSARSFDAVGNLGLYGVLFNRPPPQHAA